MTQNAPAAHGYHTLGGAEKSSCMEGFMKALLLLEMSMQSEPDVLISFYQVNGWC